MSKLMVVYWSQTGNTEIMANAVAEGVKEAGKESAAVEVSSMTPDALKDAPVFALGCPAMGAEVLEEDEMEPFMAEVESFAKGKQIGLFGSYGWGDGEWMRTWEEKCRKDGAELVCDSVICSEEPGDDEKEACRKLGKSLAL